MQLEFGRVSNAEADRPVGRKRRHDWCHGGGGLVGFDDPNRWKENRP